MRKFKYSFNVARVVYDDGNPNPPDPNKPNDPQGGEPPKSYTPDEFKKALQAEQAKARKQIESHAQQLEELKKSSNLTAAEKEQLSQRIEELNGQLLSKEQLAKSELEKTTTKHKKELEAARKEAEDWRSRFESTVLKNEIITAAAKAEVHNPEDIINILSRQAKVVNIVGPDGKATDQYAVRVTHKIKDGDGEKDVSISPEESLKLMKEDPAKGYLFKGSTNSGTGMTNSMPTSKDLRNMSVEEYMKNRTKFSGAS